MKGMRQAGALLAAALLLSGCTPAEPGAGAPPTPAPAPELGGTTLDGGSVDLESMRGSVVLVTVWASWCGPCRDEADVFADALERHADDGLEVLGVNFKDHPDAAQAFVDEESPGFPSIVDRDGTIAVEWAVTGIPETFVVDRDGMVVEHRFGAVTEEWVDRVIAEEVAP